MGSKHTSPGVRRWLRDSSGQFHTAHLVATDRSGEDREPPAHENLFCVGSNPPRYGRLRDLMDGPPLLGAFHARDLVSALPQAARGDWFTEELTMNELLALTEDLHAKGQIGGVALLFTRSNDPEAGMSERFGAIPLSVGDLRLVAGEEPGG
jgi:hypothetical protein